MKLIKDGRVFGKWTVLEFVLINYLVWCLLPGVFFGWRLFNNRNNRNTENSAWETRSISKYEYEDLKVKSDGCEKRRTEDLQGWQKRYDEVNKENVILQSKIDNFLKEHKRAIKYFK